MSLAELSKVTKVLKCLLEEGIEAFGVSSGGGPTIELAPPDGITDGKECLSLYLYHAREDESSRNMPSAADPSLGVAFSPLGLRLYYQLTAHPEESEGVPDTTGAEDLFGGALKTIHDYPILKPDTKVVGSDQALFDRSDCALQIERLTISMVNIPIEEAGSYWMGGSEPRRLSAHLEVGVVFLEPREPTTLSMPVLEQPALFVEAGLGVVVESTSSIHVIEAPGRDPRKVELTPGRPAVGETFSIGGQGWGTSPVRIRLYDPRRDEPVEIEQSAEDLSARRNTRLEVKLESPGIAGNRILPGIYSVTVTKQGGRESNRALITVCPALKVANTTSSGSGFSFELLGGPFKDTTGELELDVQVYFGQRKLEVDQDFQVEESKISVTLSDTEAPSEGEIIPLRVIVDGADSLPDWVEGES